MLKQSGKTADKFSLYNAFDYIDAKYVYNASTEVYNKYKPFLDNVTGKDKSAMSSYKNTSGYGLINQTLRDGIYPKISLGQLFRTFAETTMKKPSKTHIWDRIQERSNMYMKQYMKMINVPVHTINQLDAIFDKIEPRTLSYALFRGISSAVSNLLKKKVGDEVSFKEYLSTSLSPSTAWTFQGCGNSPCCIFVYHLQKPIPILPLYFYNHNNSESNFKDEHELLLPRGIVWKIIRKYKTAIHFNQSVMCTYTDIENSKKHLITVYEMEVVKYDKSAPIKPATSIPPGGLTIESEKQPWTLMTEMV